MKQPKNVVTFKGRYLGVLFLVGIQFIVGLIHVVFGFAMLAGVYSTSAFSMTPMIYSYYTFVYGCLTLLFAYLFWVEKRLGWIGTVAISLFIIVADILTAFESFNPLGIPKLAAIGEVPFSILILVYLLQSHVRTKYHI